MVVLPGARSNRHLTIPIDPKRPTKWALVEFLFCVQRDLRAVVRRTAKPTGPAWEQGERRLGRRHLTIPIDPTRPTTWALVEFLFCVQRAAVRSRRARRWWRVLVWLVTMLTATGAGVVGNRNAHLIWQLLDRLVK